MPISKEIIIKNCCICNKPFKLSYNQKITYYKDPNNKFFCSKKCRGKYDSITRTKPMKQINMNGNIPLDKISDINKSWAKYLNINEFEFPIKSYSYDLKINKILIEIDPTWTHHSKEINSFFSGVTYDYHLNKTNLA